MKISFLSIFLFLMGTMIPAQGLSETPTRKNESVLLFAGQSREEFRDYVEDVTRNGRATPLPTGATLYTSLHLTGFEQPHQNVPGDHTQDLQFLLKQPDPLMLQIGLWLSPAQVDGIAQGRFDPSLRRMGERLAKTKRPVFLRIGYEFDGPHNHYPPTLYQEAYLH